jgi:hypothetical protein
VIEVTAFESGNFWVIDIPALNGITQALKRDEIQHMAFDYFECQTDTKADPNNFKFNVLEGGDAEAYSSLLKERFEAIDREIAAFDSAKSDIAS